MVPVAVRETVVPAQTTGNTFGVMTTPTGSMAETFIVTTFDNDGFPVAQTALEANSHTILSPFSGKKVYAGLFVPKLNPLTFHW